MFVHVSQNALCFCDCQCTCNSYQFTKTEPDQTRPTKNNFQFSFSWCLCDLESSPRSMQYIWNVLKPNSDSHHAQKTLHNLWEKCCQQPNRCFYGYMHRQTHRHLRLQQAHDFFFFIGVNHKKDLQSAIHTNYTAVSIQILWSTISKQLYQNKV